LAYGRVLDLDPIFQYSNIPIFHIFKGGCHLNKQDLKKLDTKIKAIRKAAHELKELGSAIPAVNRNADRILASVKMLEINITDLLPQERSK
jgi:hypothetical protein